MLTSPDVQEYLDKSILVGVDDKVGGLVQESTGLLGRQVALEELEDRIASNGSDDTGFVSETLHQRDGKSFFALCATSFLL